MAVGASRKYPGVFSLVFLNFLVFGLDRVLGLPLDFLYLSTNRPRLYQWFSSLFCHGNYAHLSGNLFFLYVFGRLIEEEEGTAAIWISYLVCGIGANGFVLLLSGNEGVYLGASGAIYGLFMIAMLIKFRPRFVNLMEVLILFPFVTGYLRNEFTLLGSGDQVAHDAHLYGALVGVLLIALLHYLNRKAR
jgi:membrane associated rhomboid family serine protease